MELDQQLGNGQPESCSLGFFMCRGCTIEWLKDLVHIIGRDAGSDIPHGDQNVVR